ncbi:sensor histidine kinase [Oceanobacillus rekensis]|uniref:sensor histidine kinase n=1 Tax=Oceanobacillus rekensis TaxID=937927 RepID=UPI000B4454F8|nr:sensor histidine kinase [Oceanobacillus rekensis]
MIKNFLLERLPWILLFCFLNLLLLFIGYVDPSIPFTSFLYIVFLSVVIFILFLIIRYQKEISFYKSLEELHPSLELESLLGSNTPYEKIIRQAFERQSLFLKQETNMHTTQVEQERDELLSWIHEVKTPLTTMQLMIDRVDNEALRAQLQYEWLRIHLLLDQQLHQRRILSIENDLYIERLSLESIIYSEIKALQSWCFQKGTGFNVTLVTKEVLSDGKWLGFIIRQLLTNAVKYSENTDIIISSTEHQGMVRLTIQDYGRGIDPRDMPRLFDKGFTSTTNHKNHGATGMGLYLAKKAAKSLEVQLTVQSILNEGTTFLLTFARKNDFVKLTSM